MDCVAVYEAGEIKVCEMRRVKAGDLVVMGRSDGARRASTFIMTALFSRKTDTISLLSVRGAPGKPPILWITTLSMNCCAMRRSTGL